MITTLSTLIAFLLLEFAVPLMLKNGQTLGKKIFGVAVVRVDGVKVSPVMVFARGILGKCTIGTLAPRCQELWRERRCRTRPRPDRE